MKENIVAYRNSCANAVSLFFPSVFRTFLFSVVVFRCGEFSHPYICCHNGIIHSTWCDNIASHQSEQGKTMERENGATEEHGMWRSERKTFDGKFTRTHLSFNYFQHFFSLSLLNKSPMTIAEAQTHPFGLMQCELLSLLLHIIIIIIIVIASQSSLFL